MSSLSIAFVVSSRQYTAFPVPNKGLFHFPRMSFGLLNAPATWKLEKVFGHDLELNCFVYLDDGIVVTKTFEEFKVLNEVLR